VSARVSFSLVALAAASLVACGSEDPEPAPQVEVSPGADAPAPALDPSPAPEPEVDPTLDPTPEPPPEVDPDPVVAERKQALANVGRSAFDALESGDFEALLALTPLVDPYLGEVCAKLPLSPRKELGARFKFCHEAIAWDAVAEAQVFAGKPTGDPATGCDAKIEDYGRLQLFAHMKDASIWRIEFYGAVGEQGKVIGLNGEVRCSPTQDAPSL